MASTTARARNETRSADHLQSSALDPRRTSDPACARAVHRTSSACFVSGPAAARPGRFALLRATQSTPDRIERCGEVAASGRGRFHRVAELEPVPVEVDLDHAPVRKRPRISASDRASSMWRWIARRSGRAPKERSWQVVSTSHAQTSSVTSISDAALLEARVEPLDHDPRDLRAAAPRSGRRRR